MVSSGHVLVPGSVFQPVVLVGGQRSQREGLSITGTGLARVRKALALLVSVSSEP